jgi:beta-phosphoglucomutase-like phosphatase (HAD superfamily)
VPIDLIIFDCDGVLVDSETIACRTHAQTLTRHGYPITEEQVRGRCVRRYAGIARFGPKGGAKSWLIAGFSAS